MNKKLLLETYAFQDMISEMSDQEFSEQYLQEAFANISEDKLEKARISGEKNIKTISKFLKDKKISTSMIKVQAKKAANMAKNMFKQNVPVEKAAIKIISTVGKDTFKKIKAYVTEMDLSKKIITSILIFFIVLFVNSFIMQLTIIFGMIISSTKFCLNVFFVLIAPIIEETAKKCAIEEGYPFVFTAIFSGLEFLMYVGRLMALGMSLPKIILIRAIGVSLHFTTTIIQKHYHDKSIAQNNKDIQYQGYIIAISIHVLFNLAAITFQSGINSWASS